MDAGRQQLRISSSREGRTDILGNRQEIWIFKQVHPRRDAAHE
jgi:hypothetical protein